MRLLEYQAKRLLASHGVLTPQGVLVENGCCPRDLKYPAVLKAQIPVGGRGKAGAVVRVRDGNEGLRVAQRMFGSTVSGYTVRQILAEEEVNTGAEIYLSVTFDITRPSALILASAEGGIGVEEVSSLAPDKIIHISVCPRLGVTDPVVRFLADKLSVGIGALADLLRSLLGVFCEYDATLVEINPIAVVGEQLVALDAKIVLDDNAAFRHEELHAQLRAQQVAAGIEETDAQAAIRGLGMTYVPMPGDIGIISDGAGTGMLTIDLVSDGGGRPADFCELGGAAGAETVSLALRTMLANPAVHVVLISLLGGLTRMDDVAAGIVDFLEQRGTSVPLVVRLSGTKEEEGRAMLEPIGIKTTDDLQSAVRLAVALVEEG